MHQRNKTKIENSLTCCRLLRGISGRGIVGGGGTFNDRLGGIGGGGPAAVDLIATVGSDVVFVNVASELVDVLFRAGNGGGTVDEAKLLLLLE